MSFKTAITLKQIRRAKTVDAFVTINQGGSTLALSEKPNLAPDLSR